MLRSRDCNFRVRFARRNHLPLPKVSCSQVFVDVIVFIYIYSYIICIFVIFCIQFNSSSLKKQSFGGKLSICKFSIANACCQCVQSLCSLSAHTSANGQPPRLPVYKNFLATTMCLCSQLFT